MGPHQQRPPFLGCLGLQRSHQRPRAPLAAGALLHQQGVHLGAEGPRLGVVELEHGDAADRGARGGWGGGSGRGKEDDDDARATGSFGDAFLPPRQKFIVLERGDKGAGHVVGRDA